jgi:hypothetical protein
MKTKKTAGIKQKNREEKKKEQRIALAFMVAILIIIISISGFLIYSMLNHPSPNQIVISTSEPKAAIVDHLSLTMPNQTFVETATNILKQAGCTVDYYPGEKVTVGFYRNLATHGYRIVILRVHSSATNPDGTEGPVTLFTSERYDRAKYVSEQLADQLAGVAYSEAEMREGQVYFGINPQFVTGCMKGTFQDTVVIMIGCEGLRNPSIAMAFKSKGARAYIGWDKSIYSSRTDTATVYLLQHLLIERQTLNLSIERAMKEVGLDPAGDSSLGCYPREVGNQTIVDQHTN